MSDLISRAERFARARHEEQFRKGKAREPYTIHLEEVAALVECWNDSCLSPLELYQYLIAIGVL